MSTITLESIQNELIREILDIKNVKGVGVCKEDSCSC